MAECGDTIPISRNCREIGIMSPYSLRFTLSLRGCRRRRHSGNAREKHSRSWIRGVSGAEDCVFAALSRCALRIEPKNAGAAEEIPRVRERRQPRQCGSHAKPLASVESTARVASLSIPEVRAVHEFTPPSGIPSRPLCSSCCRSLLRGQARSAHAGAGEGAARQPRTPCPARAPPQASPLR